MSQDIAPSEQTTSDGSTAFSQDRLRKDAHALLGVGSNVVAGALHGVSTPYLTVPQAKVLVTDFLARPV